MTVYKRQEEQSQTSPLQLVKCSAPGRTIYTKAQRNHQLSAFLFYAASRTKKKRVSLAKAMQRLS